MHGMLDSANRAIRYRDRAAECCRLAKIMKSSSEIRSHYLRIAKQYITLAEAEELLPGAAIGAWLPQRKGPATTDAPRLLLGRVFSAPAPAAYLLPAVRPA
jgi:hypothetical protein